MRTIEVNSIIPPTQLVAAGDSPTLIANTDVNNVVWLGDDVGLVAGRPDSTVSLSPLSWLVVDGMEDVFAITNAGIVVAVEVIQHGLSYFQSGITGGGFQANNNGAFFYDGIPGPGNLIMSITGTNAPGTDQFGNTYTPGGVCIIGEAGATNLFNVVDQSVPPNTLAQISADGSFTSSGVISADTDLIVRGLSVPDDIITPMPQGLIARTSVPVASLPAPGSPTSSEFYLYELDVTFGITGREFLAVVDPIAVLLTVAGKIRIGLYATTDGSQPTNASPLLAMAEEVANTTQNLTIRTQPLAHQFNPNVSNQLWRFLVSINAFSVGAGVPSFQMTGLGANIGGDGYAGSQARLSIYDMGITVPNTGRVILSTGGGSGGGTQNYTKTYTATGSHSYQGSDGGNPNLKINDNGTAYQGGDRSNTYNGRAKTWFDFNTTAIQSDLSGATINWVKIFLNNNHSWYNSGMTASIGYDNITGGFGSTRGDPSGGGISANEPHFNEGQSKWVTVSNAFGTNFKNGTALQVVVFKASNSLTYYGYFQGNNGCQMQINYTK